MPLNLPITPEILNSNPTVFCQIVIKAFCQNKKNRLRGETSR